MKVWLATVVAILAPLPAVQRGMDLPVAPLVEAALDQCGPSLVGPGSRSCYRSPIAYHCIFLLGFQETSTRTLAHSFLGCFFYGAFAAKVTIVRLHNYPRWVLPCRGRSRVRAADRALVHELALVLRDGRRRALTEVSGDA